ncbi:MAG: hypothetical protein H7832_02790 [Magnetococcus sp. DMHC-6]
MSADFTDKLMNLLFCSCLQNKILQKVPLLGNLQSYLRTKNVFGMGIAPRELHLPLMPSVQRLSVRLPMAEEVLANWKQWFEEEKFLLLLTEMAVYLEGLNKSYHISPQERFDRLQVASLYAFPILERLYFANRKKVSLPSRPEDRALTLAGIRVTEALLKGFAYQFDIDFCQFNHRYIHVRHRISLLGVRILEMMYTCWLLQALQYQKMTLQYLTIANKLFYLLYHFETTTEPKNTLSPSGWILPTGLTDFGLGYMPVQSVQDLFIKIQLLARLDVGRLSPEHLHFVLAYLEAGKKEVNLSSTEAPPPTMPMSHLRVDRKESPALPNSPSKPEVFLFDPQPFLNRLHNDLEVSKQAILQPTLQTELQEPLFRLDATDRVLVLEQMLMDVSGQSLPYETPHFKRDPDLHLFISFKTIFGTIQSLRTLGVAAFQESLSFPLTLARSSSVLTNVEDKKEIADFNQWQVGTKTVQGELVLRLTESSSTRPFRIGTLLAFAKAPEYIFTLGMVARIQRTGESAVEFSVRLWTEGCEPMTLFQHLPPDEPLNVLVFQDEQRYFCIHPRHAPNHPMLRTGQTVYLYFQEQSSAFELGSPLYAGPEVVLRELMGSSLIASSFSSFVAKAS